MMASTVMLREVCAAIRNLLASVPPVGSSAQRRADFQVRKAEVLDLIAATDPHLAATARELAAHARYQAQVITHHPQY